MPIQAEWYDPEETIRIWRFTEKWTWDEFFTLLKTSVPIAEAKPYRIDIILDFSNAVLNVPNLITNFKTGEAKSGKNVVLLVAVGNTYIGVMQKVFRTFVGRVRDKLLYSENVEAAAELIRASRAKAVSQR